MKNSKKIFLPINLCLAGFMSVCSAFMVSAEILSPAEALARMYGENANTPAKVRGEFKQFSPDDLVAVVESSSAPCAYVVSGDAGYAVVSADSRSVPLLGYGDHTIDSISSLPPAMLWWIRNYAEEFSDMPEDAAHVVVGRAERHDMCAVAPLCSTRWGQGDPYNHFCPEQNGKKTWVGCVATSMAQIMHHFNWPERGTGHHSYTWNDTEIALDFSEQEFRWDLMLPDYKTGYSQEQADAVARLSYACGVAVDMNYGLGGSGAEGEEQAHALTAYFDYGKSTTLLDRSDFYTSDWERMMHESLMAGAPVAYMGFANGGGHAFLLDGYDGEGFFSFQLGMDRRCRRLFPHVVFKSLRRVVAGLYLWLQPRSEGCGFRFALSCTRFSLGSDV